MDYIDRLAGVDPRLILVILTAGKRYEILNPNHIVRIAVFGGKRSLAQQQRLVKDGLSPTMDSKHLKGLAVDIAIIDMGKVEMIHDLKPYSKFNDLVQQVCEEFELIVAWGGHFKSRDGVHFEIASRGAGRLAAF